MVFEKGVRGNVKSARTRIFYVSKIIKITGLAAKSEESKVFII